MLTGNTKSLIEAARRLNISYSIVDEESDFVSIHLKRPYYFMHSTVPLNSLDVGRICSDKSYTYTLLQNRISFPKTMSFLDPEYHDFNDRSPFDSIEDIHDEIIKNFDFPLVIKMNSGSRGKNVFSCANDEQIYSALNEIYRKNSPNYDYLALAQEKIAIKQELRVIVVAQKVVLVYEKYTFKPVTDIQVLQRIESFLSPLYEVLNLEYGGFDIAIDLNDKIKVIEINSTPRFGPYIKRNNMDAIVHVYEQIIQYLIAKEG